MAGGPSYDDGCDDDDEEPEEPEEDVHEDEEDDFEGSVVDPSNFAFIASLEEEQVSMEEIIEMECCVAFFVADKNLEDPVVARECQELCTAETTAYLAKEKLRSKGFKDLREHRLSVRPKSELTLDERRRLVQKAKENSRCRKCKGWGHWEGDPKCPLLNHGPKAIANQPHDRKGKPPYRPPPDGVRRTQRDSH